MTTASLAREPETQPTRFSGVRMSITLVLALWFVLVVSLGAAGSFIAAAGKPPIAMAAAVSAPLLLFFVALRISPSVRDFLLSLDLRVIAGIQAWRWAGIGFLSLYAHNILPAMFALPAGLGDMAVGFAAPWMIYRLLQRPDFAASGTFIRWNLFGMLDLVVAVSLGALSATLSTGTPGEISSAPMATLPLLLIPAFFVPIFLMLHIVALMRSRHAARP